MIGADANDMGPVLDLEPLSWLSEVDERRSRPPGSPPDVTVTLGRPLGWWGPDRPGGTVTDRWLIVRFAVSHRTDRGTKVEWSRLTVDLPTAGDNNQLIVTDQYPVNVLDEEMRDVRLTLSPQLKFMQVSAAIGTVSTVIQTARITPITSAWGGQESSFGWDLTATDRHPLAGVRHFFAVVPCPEPALAVSLGVDADARTAGGYLWRGHRSKPSQQRQFDIALRTWG